MEYNPIAKEYNRLHTVIKDKNSERQILTSSLSWFEKSGINKFHSTLNLKQIDSKKLKTMLDDAEQAIDVLNSGIRAIKRKVKTRFNPFNWFDSNQINFRNQLSSLEKDRTSRINKRDSIAQSLKTCRSAITTTLSDIDKYNKFDRNSVKEGLAVLTEELACLTEKLETTAYLKQKVDTLLLPVKEQITKYESTIESSKATVSSANEFEKELNGADNSYGRAMIHKECEEKHGSGRPKQIIRQHEQLILQAQRNLEKAKKRAIEIGEKASRNISKIVIDGNNLCYEGSEFIGLSPLKTLTNELQKKYETMVVFDSAIRSLLKAGDTAIRSEFDSSVSIYVVATKQLADETILDVSENEEHCYIISNDRFGEYKDKEVVKNNRLIRHEILFGKVLINDLNINLKYRRSD